jgi:hypothetical protein
MVGEHWLLVKPLHLSLIRAVRAPEPKPARIGVNRLNCERFDRPGMLRIIVGLPRNCPAGPTGHPFHLQRRLP